MYKNPGILHGSLTVTLHDEHGTSILMTLHHLVVSHPLIHALHKVDFIVLAILRKAIALADVRQMTALVQYRD